MTGLVLGVATALAGTKHIHAQTSTPEGKFSTELLPRDAILPVEAVHDVLPEITGETGTGQNATVVGSPVANRAVTFSSSGGTQHVVLSVDQYRSADEARRSFDEAFAASQEVPGVTTEAVSDLGDAALIGVVTQASETHDGGGALFGSLIVNATLQSFDGTNENKQNVAELIRRQAGHAEQALGIRAASTPAG